MAFAATLNPAGMHASEPDSALGSDGVEIRRLLREACDRPTDQSREILARVLSSLREAEDRDGTRVSPELVKRTREFLATLPSAIPLPCLFVESDHEMGLDWDRANDNVLSLTLCLGNDLGYSGIVIGEAAYGRVKLGTNEFPATLVHFLDRLYRRPSPPSRS